VNNYYAELKSRLMRHGQAGWSVAIDAAVAIDDLERNLAKARNEAMELAKQIDPFDTDDTTYQILRKYIPEFPESHPMEKKK